VRRIAELVDRRDARQAIAAIDEYSGVADERRRIARDGDHQRDAACGERLRLRLSALARRIEHNAVVASQLTGQERAAEQIAHVRFDRLEPRRDRRGAGERCDRGLRGIGGGDTGALGKPQGKGADAGKQVDDVARSFRAFADQHGEPYFARRGRLQERAGRQRHLRAPDGDRWNGRLRDELAVPGDPREPPLRRNAGECRRLRRS